MADLSQIAKNSTIYQFEIEWCKENKISYSGMTTAQHASAQGSYHSYRKMKSSSSYGTSSFGDTARNTATGIGNSQNIPVGLGGISAGNTEIIQLSDGIKGITEATKMTGTLFQNFTSAAMKGVNALSTQLGDFLEKEVKLRNTINIELGLSGKLSDDYKENINEAYASVIGMGYSFEDLRDTVVETSKNAGTMAIYSSEIWKKGAVASRDFLESFKDLPIVIKNMEEVGIGGSDAMDKINTAGLTSMSLGLRAKKVVTDLNENLSKLNKFGFKDGIEGLTRMVQKSIEFKISMEKTSAIAEKLFDPEAAVDLSANLQAIGGAIGEFNDPIKLMYDATNDVGKLQDAIIGVAGSLATYNQEQGKFEITPVNLRKSKALAEQFGMSMEELGKTAIKTAERSSASTALMSRGLKLSDKEQEFLTNISRMEGGKMVIDVSSISKEFGGATSLQLDKLTEEQSKALLKNREYLEAMKPEDVARAQLTQTQNMALNVMEIAGYLKVRGYRGVNEVGKQFDAMGGRISKSLSGTTVDINQNKKDSGVVKTGDVIEGMGTGTAKVIEYGRGIYGEVRDIARHLLGSTPTPNQVTSIKVDNTTKTNNAPDGMYNTKNPNGDTTITHKHEHSFKTDQNIMDKTTAHVMQHPEIINWMEPVSSYLSQPTTSKA